MGHVTSISIEVCFIFFLNYGLIQVLELSVKFYRVLCSRYLCSVQLKKMQCGSLPMFVCFSPAVVQGRKIVAREKKRMPGCGVQNKHV